VQFIPILLMALAAGLLAYSALDLIVGDKSQVQRRLHGLTAYEATEAAAAEPLLKSFSERVLRPGMRRASAVARSLWPDAYSERTRMRLQRAGRPGNLDAEGFVALKLLSGAAGVVLGGLLFLPRAANFGGALFGGLLVGALTFFIPDMWLAARTSSRQLAMRRALPDMLDMLTISVEAGLAFDGAVAKLVSNGSGPLAEEFSRMLKEVQAGISRQDAFRHLADRTGVAEISTFCMAMIQADVFGISVANVLRTQARDMRVRRRQAAEEAAQKAPVKIVFPLILCILPATLIVILGPAVVGIARAFGLVH
jgi:tight adherence protein C